MTHSVRCFLCRANEAEPGDMCEVCKFRIHRMEIQVDSEVEAAGPSPMRSWARRRVAEIKVQRAKRLSAVGVQQ
jgi:hypothetical protein